MSWRTNSFVLALRSIGRALGLNKWIASLFFKGGYEARYDASFTGALRQGYCVWDVGANVGYYTRLFSERVGESGRVYAFEPSPMNFDRLTAGSTCLTNVRALRCGLGAADGKLHFQQGADDLGATSRIVEAEADGVVVEIRSGMSLIDSGEAPIPNAIKIDVEGFEFEVLQGLGMHLRKPDLRIIGIEVHFGILKERGVPHVPEHIETLLTRNGFAVSWADASHIIAVRI